MILKTLDINLDYKKLGCEKIDYQPKLHCYIPNETEELEKYMPTRPTMLIIPGGGYGYTSDRETEPIALFYLSKGYNCFVLKYTCAPAHFPVQLAEAATALLMIKENAAEWRVDTNKINVIGFSAGGHLAASLGVFWDKPFLADILGTTNEMLKFNALILAYPVITYKPVAEINDEKRKCLGTVRTFVNLLGEDRFETEADYHCLDTQVSANTPPCFIWSTFEDATVPVECSLLFALALRKHNVPTELHIYEHGRHGQSTGTIVCCNSNQRLKEWMEASFAWLEEEHGLPQA